MELMGKSREELQALCKALGEPGYRAAQIYHALYAERKFSLAEMSNLPVGLREKLGQEAKITLPDVKRRYLSTEGPARYFFGLRERGHVLVPLTEMAVKAETLGGPGLAARTNVVLMGQGEPLLNFDNVMAAMRILLDQRGVGLSPKYVAISTSGIVPGIEKLGKEEVRPKLAISLNASNDEQRDALMPINRKYPLKMLLEACKAYPLRKWEYLMFEYVMLGGVNDTKRDALRVVKLLAPLTRVKVNLIPWNPGELPYRESSGADIEEFQRILIERGVPTYVRYSRGRDVMAACGQLALQDAGESALKILG